MVSDSAGTPAARKPRIRARRGEERNRGGHDQQLPAFDAEVEGHQPRGQRRPRQLELPERTGEPEAVDQPEDEGEPPAMGHRVPDPRARSPPGRRAQRFSPATATTLAAMAGSTRRDGGRRCPARRGRA